MLICNKTALAIAFFALLASLGQAQINIQPSAAKAGNCSGSITVNITGNAGQYLITLIKKPENETLASKSIIRGAHTFKDLCAGNYGIDVEIPMDYGRTCTLHYEASVASDCGNITLEGLEEAKHAPSDCQTKDGYLQFGRLDGPMGGNPPFQMNLYGPNGALIPASAGGWQNLGVGNYELRVKDAQECEAHFPFILGSASDAELVAYLESVNIDLPCGGLNNGALELVFLPEGAQYSWSNGATTQRLSNLPAGDYTLTLSNGQCTASRTFELRDQVFPPLVIDEDVLPVCTPETQNGSIRIKVTGGSEPYQIKWDQGWMSTTLNYLKAGTYTVSVTDRCKSSVQESYSITVAEPIVIEENITRTCPQSATGSIQLAVSGGTAPYQYKWSTGATSNPITGLNAGKYSVTVTDKGQCRAFDNFEVTASDLALEITDIVGCDGNNCANAKVDISVKGGTSPYGYLWTGSNGFQSHNQNLSNVTQAGAYTIVVTDADLCTYRKEVNLAACNNGENISVASTVYPAGGVTSKGAIFLTVTPNNVDYVYSWTGPNGFTSSKEDISPANGEGNYNLTIKGPCQNQNYQRSFEIAACNLTLEVESVQNACSNAGYGTAVILLKNVNANDEYFFDNSRGIATEAKRVGSNIRFVIERLSPGVLIFSVLRKNDNCSAELRVTISPSSIHPTIHKSYITGIDQETQLPRPFYCVTETRCQSILVDYKIEPYSVKIESANAAACYGSGTCGSSTEDLYSGVVVNKVSVRGNICYRGLACQMRSWRNNFGYTVALDGGIPLGLAQVRVQDINGRCIYEVHCPNDGSGLPVQSIDIGKAEFKANPTPSCGLSIPEIKKLVCVKNMLLCDNKLVSYEVDESRSTDDCCPRALSEEDTPSLSFRSALGMKPELIVRKNADYQREETTPINTDTNLTGQILTLGTMPLNPTFKSDDYFKNEEVVVFPNPFNAEISILLPSFNEVGKEFNIALYTLQGRLVHQLITTNHETTLDLPNLPQGAYFLKVTSKQGEIWVKKLIKMP